MDRAREDPRLRVLMLIARMNVGGPAQQVVTLLDGLPALGISVRALTGSVADGEADYRDMLDRPPALSTIKGLGRAVRPSDDARALAAVVREMRRFRPHVVHTHTAKAGAVGRVAAGFLRVPVVHTFHGHLLDGYFSPNGRRAVVATERLLARRTAKIVTVGARVRDELLAAGIGRAGQYVVVPPGVSPPAAVDRLAARRRLGLAPDVPVVSFAARLTGVKRPDRAAAVMRLVWRELPQAVLVVAGDGPLAAEFRRLAEERPEQVRLLGWRRDVATVFGASDLTLLTSDNEGTPITLIEAAWCGVPAVATDVGSVGEVVADCRSGLLSALDPESLAAAVVQLLRDAARRDEMGTAARRLAAECFDPKRMVERMAGIYRAAATEKPAAIA